MDIHTDFRAWVSHSLKNIRQDPFVGFMISLRGVHNGVLFSGTSRVALGTNVFERDWDLLIILDACRVDAIREVAPEYDLIDSVDSIWSVGSASHEWMVHTFTTDYLDTISDTILVSTKVEVPQIFREKQYLSGSYPIPLTWANWNIVDEHDFNLIKLLTEHGYGRTHSTPPDVVTDNVIQISRNNEFERMVAHYFQPHRPYISQAYREDRPLSAVEEDPWTAIQEGRATTEEVWELYIENLRFVLDSLERLLENVDAERVVISADHGDLFGEWGAYGHPEGVLHPSLRKVPWVEVGTTD